jgi:hypothetical protein
MTLGWNPAKQHTGPGESALVSRAYIRFVSIDAIASARMLTNARRDRQGFALQMTPAGLGKRAHDPPARSQRHEIGSFAPVTKKDQAFNKNTTVVHQLKMSLFFYFYMIYRYI